MFLRGRLMKVNICIIIMAHIVMCHSSVLAQEYEISPPFGLEWLDHVSVLPQKTNVTLRSATKEEASFINRKIYHIDREILPYVADRCLIYGITFKGFFFTREHTGKLTVVSLFKGNSSIDEFNSVCKQLYEKYGESKDDNSRDQISFGVQKYEKKSWRKTHSKISVSFASTILGGNELLIVYLAYY